jgi:hypothetical protein
LLVDVLMGEGVVFAAQRDEVVHDGLAAFAVRFPVVGVE